VVSGIEVICREAHWCDYAPGWWSLHQSCIAVVNEVNPKAFRSKALLLFADEVGASRHVSKVRYFDAEYAPLAVEPYAMLGGIVHE
jgi:hypothetical protein